MRTWTRTCAASSGKSSYVSRHYRAVRADLDRLDDVPLRRPRPVESGAEPDVFEREPPRLVVRRFEPGGDGRAPVADLPEPRRRPLLRRPSRLDGRPLRCEPVELLPVLRRLDEQVPGEIVVVGVRDTRDEVAPPPLQFRPPPVERLQVRAGRVRLPLLRQPPLDLARVEQDARDAAPRGGVEF